MENLVLDHKATLKSEFVLMYSIGALALFLTGAGKYNVASNNK